MTCDLVLPAANNPTSFIPTEEEPVHLHTCADYHYKSEGTVMHFCRACRIYWWLP